MLEVKIKKLVENAVIPEYAHKGYDAGMDLVAVSKEKVETKDYGYISYGTGLAIGIPQGYVGLLFPRSSISKTGMWLSNAVGVIDSGYSGEVSFRFKAIPNTKEYEIGEKIGQLIIIPYPQVQFVEVDNLDNSERGSNGFGSSGK